MARNRFNNARILEWLSLPLDESAASLACAKVQVNSAAVWWFCSKLSPEERAQILGEFVSENARRMQSNHDGKSSKNRVKKPKKPSNDDSAG